MPNIDPAGVLAFEKKTLWKLLRRIGGIAEDACIRSLVGPELSSDLRNTHIEALLDEVRKDRAIAESLVRNNKHLDVQIDLHARLSGGWRSRALLLYVLLRIAQPSTVVETGCATGWDTTLILRALRQNGVGQLFSIDLPAREGEFGMNWTLPEGKSPGILIPDYLKDRWTLITGDVRIELPKLLERVRPVDVFYHDSDHSYVHMMWEFTTIWPCLGPQGVLVSDDISSNTAFVDFAEGVGRKVIMAKKHGTNFGALSRSRWL